MWSSLAASYESSMVGEEVKGWLTDTIDRYKYK